MSASPYDAAETAARKLWTEQGVPQAKQDEIIADIRLSRSRRALLVKLTEQSIKGQWTTAPNTAGGGGIERHWFSWLHAD